MANNAPGTAMPSGTMVLPDLTPAQPETAAPAQSGTSPATPAAPLPAPAQ